MAQPRRRARSVIAASLAVVVFAVLAKPMQIILSAALIMAFSLAFGDSAEVAGNAEATANIVGLILALLAAFGTYRLIAKSKKGDGLATTNT